MCGQNHTTETAFNHTLSDLCLSLDQGQSTLFTPLNLSSAFDMILLAISSLGLRLFQSVGQFQSVCNSSFMDYLLL